MCIKEIEKLKEILHSYNNNPELIDNSPETAPSKRIIKAIEGSGAYKYNKPRSGAAVAAAIGMHELLKHCLHFSKWIERIEKTKR